MNRPPVAVEMVVRSWLGVQKRFVVGLEEAVFPAPIPKSNWSAIGAKSAPIQFGALRGREMAQAAPIALPNWPAIGAAPFPSPKGGLRKAQQPSQASTQPEGIREEIKAARAVLRDKSVALAKIDDRLFPVMSRVDSIMAEMRTTHRTLHSDLHPQDLLIFDPTRAGERAPLWAELDAIRANPETMAMRKARNELRGDVRAIEREIEGMERQLKFLERKRSRKATAHAA
jgi:hypothetical protein